MNGQMMKFNMSNYQKSLKNTPERKPLKIFAINYHDMILYAKEKGVTPASLSEEEKQKFYI